MREKSRMIRRLRIKRSFMHPTVSQYAQSLEELSLGKTGDEIVSLSRNFFALLRRRGESKKIPAIIHHLEAIQDEKEGRMNVTAVLAHTADGETKKKIILEAQKLFPGKNVTIEYRIDNTIIGGVRFYTEEFLYSATVVDALASLRQSFLKA